MLMGPEFVVITKYTKDSDEHESTRFDYYKKKEDAFKAKKCFETSDAFKDNIDTIGVYQTAFVPVEED